MFGAIYAVGTLCWAPELQAQTPSLLPASPPPSPSPPSVSLRPHTASASSELPEAPAVQQDVVSVAHAAFAATGDPDPSFAINQRPTWETDSHPALYKRIQQKRSLFLSDQRFLSEAVSIPLTSRQKAYIAATDLADPGNLAVIAASSAVYTASTPHSAYGPGLKGFGRNYGYSLAQDATGEFLSTWLIPSITHQDPRYHRLPGAPVRQRILHALSHTVVTRHDDGSPALNYATLLTYPISAEIANLYVPGLETSGSATAKRVFIGLASDPADALIGEFLPDVARRIHIRVTFFQQVINDLSTERPE